MADQAMMQALLRTYGAAPTPRNMQQAQQFFASNPDQLERRAMGMRGSDGNNDNTDLLGPMLDKLIADSSTAKPDEMATAQAMQPERPTATPAQAQTPKRAPGGGGSAATEPTPYAPVEDDARFAKNGPAAPDKSGDWLNNILLSLLGTSSVAGRGMMSGKPAAPVMEPIAPGRNAMGKAVPQITDERAGQKLLTGPQARLPAPAVVEEVPSVVKSDPTLEAQGKKNQLQAEVDAENNELSAMQRSQQEKLAKERANSDLVKAAKKTVGRK